MKYLKILIFGVLFSLGGMVLYVFVLQKMCWSPAFYCGTYNRFAVIITAYGNFVMQFIRPDCVKGGPDDCIGPALTIMLCTLLAVGFLLGWLIFRNWKKNNY
jgi:hypothetical protein